MIPTQQGNNQRDAGPNKIQAAPWAWVALALFTGLNILNYFDRSVMPAVLTPLKLALHLKDDSAGVGESAFMFGYFLAAPLFGYLGDRYSRKYLLLGGVTIWSIATALTGLAQGMYDLIAIRIFVGVGEACFVMICPAWISDLYPARSRNNALTLFYTAVPIGAALGYIFGGHFASAEWWRYGFVWAGVPGIALALLVLLMKEPKKGASDDPEEMKQAVPHEEGESVWTSLVHLVTNTKFILLTAGYTSIVFAIGAFQNWGENFLERLHGLTPSQANNDFGVLLVSTGLVGTLCGGFLATYLRRLTSRGYALVLAGAVIPSIPTTIYAFLTPDSTSCLVALGISMFLLFLPTAPASSQLYEFVSGADRAKATGVMTFFLHLFGDLLSPILVGIISAHTAYLYLIPDQSLQAGLFILPVALLAGAVFWSSLIFVTGTQANRSH